jgi:hypothetical protein
MSVSLNGFIPGARDADPETALRLFEAFGSNEG